MPYPGPDLYDPLWGQHFKSVCARSWTLSFSGVVPQRPANSCTFLTPPGGEEL